MLFVALTSSFCLSETCGPTEIFGAMSSRQIVHNSFVVKCLPLRAVLHPLLSRAALFAGEYSVVISDGVLATLFREERLQFREARSGRTH